MKKYKVMLTQPSARLEDGSRKVIQRKEICSCADRGTAELILSKIRDNYNVLTADQSDNVSVWHLMVE